MKTTGLILFTICGFAQIAFSSVAGNKLTSKRDLEGRGIEITRKEITHDGTKFGREETVFQVKWTPHEDYMKVVETSITLLLYEKKELSADPPRPPMPVIKTVFPVTKDGNAIATFTFQDRTNYEIILQFGNRVYFYDYLLFSEFLNDFK